jgi:hypothetical protein
MTDEVELPRRCCLCRRRPDLYQPIFDPRPPLLSRNIAHPEVVCPDCWDTLSHMITDLPWLRYQITQYVTPYSRRSYGPDGYYFGDESR